MARPGNDEIQLDLHLDYASNVALYPAFQEYFCEHRPWREVGDGSAPGSEFSADLRRPDK